MGMHELRDEAGNVIHACATESFPLPSDHWIYQEPVQPSPVSELPQDMRLKIRDALRFTIQACTSRGKDADFDPDAMLQTMEHTLFGNVTIRVLAFLAVLFSAATSYGQYPYQLDTRPAPYVRYGERYASPYATTPKLYSGGRYLGELSSNRYAPDSVSNPYGRYGSRYSPDSINNPYGPYGRYATQPIWVYPGR